MAADLNSPKKSFFTRFLIIFTVLLTVCIGLVYVYFRFSPFQMSTDSGKHRPTGNAQTTQALAFLADPKAVWADFKISANYRLALPPQFQSKPASSGTDSQFEWSIQDFRTTVRSASVSGVVGKKAFGAWVNQTKSEKLIKAMAVLTNGGSKPKPSIFAHDEFQYDREDATRGTTATCAVAPTLLADRVVYLEVCSELHTGYATTLLEAIIERNKSLAPSVAYADMAGEVALAGAFEAEVKGLTGKKLERATMRQHVWESRRGLECFGLAAPLDTEKCLHSQVEARMTALASGVDLKEPAAKGDSDDEKADVEVVKEDSPEEITGSGAAVVPDDSDVVKDTVDKKSDDKKSE